jgi:hypothetical protein
MPTRRRPRFTERDVKRAIRAAANAGLTITSIEIKADGGIAVMSAGSNPGVTELNPFEIEAERLRRQAS